MRIKHIPEDFFLREVLHFAPGKKETPWRVYLLEKKGWNTLDALKRAAREKKVPLGEIRSLGKKDRHAHTVQHLSLPVKYDLSFEGEGFSLRPAGYTTVPLEPSVLKGSLFSIKLRDMGPAEADHVEKRLEEIAVQGFANYLDDQRFGNVGAKGEFLAEMLIKRRFAEALRKYFTFCHPEAPLWLKKRHARRGEIWGRWGEMKPLCPEPLLQKMLALLEKRGEKGARDCLALLPAEELGMYFSAYSGFLWNETLSRFLADTQADLFPVPLKTGPVLQYRTLPPDLFARREGLALPMVGPDMPPLPPEIAPVFSALLAERGVRLSKFRLPEVEKASFSSYSRSCLVIPEGLEWKREEDDLFPGKTALSLEFFLPRGSYATMMLKSAAGKFKSRGGSRG
ncbi:tRNA pseudouridine(13) synthase TruD [Aminivibrio sp.]